MNYIYKYKLTWLANFFEITLSFGSKSLDPNVNILGEIKGFLHS
jgi:hypothetical protein